MKLTIKPPAEKRRVQLRWWPEAVGVVVEEGPEVSGVKFDDGTFRYITNKNLVTVKPRERLRL